MKLSLKQRLFLLLLQSPVQQQTWMTSDFGAASSHFNTVYVPVSQNDRLSSELPLLEFGELCPSGDVMVESSLAKLVN